MKYRDVLKVNLETVKLCSLQTLHYRTAGKLLRKGMFLVITDKLILVGIVSYTHVCPRSHTLDRRATASRLSHRAKCYVTLVRRCGCDVPAAEWLDSSAVDIAQL